MDHHLHGEPSLEVDSEYLQVRARPPDTDRGVARLTLTGELDGAVSARIVAAVAGALARWEPHLVEIDLAAVTFCDSAGIRCLFNCREVALSVGSELVLADPTADMHRILEIVGLLEVFGLSPRHPSSRRYLSNN
jgi:anti-sigma B factor antagonist